MFSVSPLLSFGLAVFALVPSCKVDEAQQVLAGMLNQRLFTIVFIKYMCIVNGEILTCLSKMRYSYNIVSVYYDYSGVMLQC